MAIENRNLAVGTKLSVRYKKELHTAEVVQGQDGIRYRLADGREFKSPSGAGAALKGGGKTCDGWKFWSLADGEQSQEQPAAKERPAKAKQPARSKVIRNLKKLPTKGKNGTARWFCCSCQRGFEVPEGEEPVQCPEGHAMIVEDELAPPA